jgi:hypothetical protein
MNPAGGRLIMPARTGTGRNSSHHQNTKNRERAETAIAIIWLAFYGLAVVIAITQSLVSRAIDVAAQ